MFFFCLFFVYFLISSLLNPSKGQKRGCFTEGLGGKTSKEPAFLGLETARLHVGSICLVIQAGDPGV